MKKITSILLVAVMLVGIIMAATSCGNSSKVKVDPDKEKYVVGICQLVPHVALDSATEGFKKGLTDALAAKGRTVEFKYQNAQNDINACSTIINTFISDDVDLIMANATPALLAAYNATQTIPILGTSITEYGVALELENFDGTVGGNVSGTSDLAPLTEQAQMMIDTLSLKSGAKIGLLYCSAEPNSVYQVNEVKKYLEGKGMACTEYKFNDSNDLDAVVRNAADASDAIYVPTDNTVASNTSTIDNVCRPAGVPIFAGEEGICSGCGYATLSISYYNIGLKTGEMAAKVLLGEESIETMAIQYDAAPVKKYNKDICDALGIDTAALEAAGYKKIEVAAE